MLVGKLNSESDIQDIETLMMMYFFGIFGPLNSESDIQDIETYSHEAPFGF